MPDPLIKIKNLNVTYFPGRSNEVKALKNINLEIYPGEFIIFFGPSGCGKSTLLYSISGLERRVAGEIAFENKNLVNFENKELENFHQKKIGMIFQAYYLIGSITVLKNVILPQIAIKAKKGERKKKAMELLEKFGVDKQANKFPNELSGGQQQRIAVCRSLINDPDILLADEPVGNLDSKSSEEVMNLLKELNTRDKKTIILVTHDPTHLNQAHRVCYIKDGALMRIKVNDAINKEVMETEKTEVKPPISKELELLMRTYSNILTSGTGNLLVPFKAKEIVSEALVEMSMEEIEKINKKVENILNSGIYGASEDLTEYLDKDIEKGGMGLNKTTALKLSKKIKSIVEEIKELEKEERKIALGRETITSQEVLKIRRYLFDTFKIELENDSTLNLIERAIEKRLKNEIGRKKFEAFLDLPIKKGGAGFDKRLARKVTRRMELLMLGKFK